MSELLTHFLNRFQFEFDRTGCLAKKQDGATVDPFGPSAVSREELETAAEVFAHEQLEKRSYRDPLARAGGDFQTRGLPADGEETNKSCGLYGEEFASFTKSIKTTAFRHSLSARQVQKAREWLKDRPGYLELFERGNLPIDFDGDDVVGITGM